MLASGFIFYKPLTCQQKANAQHMRKPVGHTEWEEWMVYSKNYGVKKKCIVNCCCHYNALRSDRAEWRAGAGASCPCRTGRQAEVMQAVKLIFKPKEI